MKNEDTKLLMGNTWLVFSLLALVCWGLWALLPKLAVQYLSPRSALVYETIGGLLVGVVVLSTVGSDLEFNIKGVLPSIGTGIAGYLGLLFFLYAVQMGKVSVISAVTAAYPVITVLLAALFLKEKVNPVQWAGIGLAIVSVVLMSHE